MTNANRLGESLPPSEQSPLLFSRTDSGYSYYGNNCRAEQATGVTMGRLPAAEDVGRLGYVKSAARSERMPRRNLNLRYDYYEYFVYSQCLPAWLMLVLRFIMGAVCVSVFLLITISQPFVNFVPGNSTESLNADNNLTTQQPPTFKRHFYLCYLTIWSYLVITVYFIVAMVNTISIWLCYSRQISVGSTLTDQPFSLTASGFKSTDNLISNRGDPESASAGDSSARQVGLRLQWLLCGIAANAALLVTVAYFAVLYPMIIRAKPGPINPIDVLVHGCNTAFMFIEVVFSGVPVRLVHVVYTALYGLTYGVFSLLYWLPDHSNVIYPVLLDWNHAGLTIGLMCLILFVGLPLIQLVWWLVYLTRCLVAGSLTGLRSSTSSWSPSGLRV